MRISAKFQIQPDSNFKNQSYGYLKKRGGGGREGVGSIGSLGLINANYYIQNG